MFKAKDPAYTLRNKPGTFMELWTKIDMAARQSSRTDETIDFHKRFSLPWRNRDKPIFRKVKEDSLVTVLDGLQDNFTYNELIRKFDVDATKEVLLDLLTKVDLKEDLNEFKESFTDLVEKYVTEMAEVVSFIKESDTGTTVLVRKEMPEVRSRTVEGFSAKVVGRNVITPRMAAVNLGEASYYYINQVTSDVQFYEHLAKSASSGTSEAKFFSRLNAVMNKLMNIGMNSRKMNISSDKSSADSRSIISHTFRDKYFEGAGLDNFDEGGSISYFARDHEIRLMKEERAMIDVMRKSASRHLQEIFESKKSDFRTILDGYSENTQSLDLKLIEELAKSPGEMRNISLKVFTALMTNTAIELNVDEAKAISKGRYSATSKMFTTDGDARVISSTKMITNHNELACHVVQRVSAKDIYIHHFFFKESAVTARVESAQILTSSPSVASINGMRVISSMSVGKDVFKFHYPEDISKSAVRVSPNSTMTYLQGSNFVLPLFPICPDISDLKFLTISAAEFKTAMKITQDYESDRAVTVFESEKEVVDRERESLKNAKKEYASTEELELALMTVSNLRAKFNIDTYTKSMIATRPFAMVRMVEEEETERLEIENEGLPTMSIKDPYAEEDAAPASSSSVEDETFIESSTRIALFSRDVFELEFLDRLALDINMDRKKETSRYEGPGASFLRLATVKSLNYTLRAHFENLVKRESRGTYKNVSRFKGPTYTSSIFLALARRMASVSSYNHALRFCLAVISSNL